MCFLDQCLPKKEETIQRVFTASFRALSHYLPTGGAIFPHQIDDSPVRMNLIGDDCSMSHSLCFVMNGHNLALRYHNREST